MRYLGRSQFSDQMEDGVGGPLEGEDDGDVEGGGEGGVEERQLHVGPPEGQRIARTAAQHEAGAEGGDAGEADEVEPGDGPDVHEGDALEIATAQRHQVQDVPCDGPGRVKGRNRKGRKGVAWNPKAANEDGREVEVEDGEAKRVLLRLRHPSPEQGALT